MSTERKLEALRQMREPKLTGQIISETDDAVILRVGRSSLAEIPTKNIVDRVQKGEEVEFTLSRDAELLVSIPVSTTKGFLSDDVFSALAPSLIAMNCNCNCNCDCGPYDCSRDCNCNCNCNCGSAIESADIASQLPTPAFRFRRPFTGGARQL